MKLNILSLSFFSLLFFINLYCFISDNFFNLNLFVAPIGFLVLGYYLSIKDFKIDSRKLMILMVVVFLIATCMKMLLTGAIMLKSFALDYEATQSIVLDSWVDVSIFVILQAGLLFVLFKHLNFTGFRKVVVSISNLSYGMYLINSLMMFYISPFFLSLPRNGVEICLTIIVMSVFVFVLSWLIVWVLSKIPVIGKYCVWSR